MDAVSWILHSKERLNLVSSGATIPVYEGILFTVFQGMRQRAEEQAGSRPDSAGSGLVFAFTSANQGEGVTHTVRALLAGLVDEQRTRSLLVEASSLRQLNVPPNKVEELCTPITTLPHSPLWELNDREPDSIALGAKLWTGSWEYRRDVLTQLRLLFDYVLIDCPALHTATDTLSLAPFVDGIILVVEAGKTRKEQIRNAEKSIQFAHGRLLGHILNKRSYVVPNWLYRRL